MNIRDVAPGDYEACRAIYNYYIRETTATLEFDPLAAEEFSARVEAVRARYPYLVCEDAGEVIGYAYLDAFNLREGYRRACDLSIYVHPARRGAGVGRAMYTELEKLARAEKLRDVVSIVTDENAASLRFHEKLGFCRAGEFPGIAEKFGRRLGIVYLRKILK